MDNLLGQIYIFEPLTSYHINFCHDLPLKIFLHSHGQSLFRNFGLQTKYIFWTPAPFPECFN